MYRLSSIVLALLSFIQAFSQSPHGELKVDCAACHNPSSWTPVKDNLAFDHKSTDFPLEGLHQQVDCKVCHKSLTFAEAPTQCVDCHTDIHNMSVGNECARCHTPQSWIVDIIPELHEMSGFPLVGTHSTVTCSQCHVSETNLRFSPIGNDCINCHQDNYMATTDPNHQQAGYSTNCIECHDPLSLGWTAELVNHDFFPLEQGHDINDCKRCHLTTNYSDASPECVSCHQSDYAATTNPNHTTLNFSNNCAECHTIAGWSPSNFDHNSIHPLLGAHSAIANDCNKCHAQGYTNTPNTCVGCHLADYNATTNPNHVAAQFPDDCAQCHSETAWTPSTFDHDDKYFPIYSGKHREAWNSCTECHINNNYASFSCINCHEHSNQADVDDKHKDVNGYSYTSNACFSCHPTGDD